jgi:Fe-S oxidoreductase
MRELGKPALSRTMKRFKVPEGVKEIIINDEGQVVYLKKELMEIQPDDWGVATSIELLEEIVDD